MRFAVLMTTHFAGFTLAVCALATFPADTAAGCVLGLWGCALMALTAFAPNP